MIQINDIKSGMYVRSTLTGETYIVSPNTIGSTSSMFFNPRWGYIAIHCSREDQSYHEALVDYIPIAYLDVINKS